MIRRLLIPLIGSGLLLAAGAGTALGKCEGPNPPSFCPDVVAELHVAPFGVGHAGTATGVDVSAWPCVTALHPPAAPLPGAQAKHDDALDRALEGRPPEEQDWIRSALS